MSLDLATIHCDVPVPFALETFRSVEPDLELLKPLYKELEFFSHLKELGPSEDSRARDFAPLESVADVCAFVEALPPGTPLSIALAAGAGADAGLAFRPSEARSVAEIAHRRSAHVPRRSRAAKGGGGCEISAACARAARHSCRRISRRRLALRFSARCRSGELFARSSGRAAARSPRRAARR